MLEVSEKLSSFIRTFSYEFINNSYSNLYFNCLSINSLKNSFVNIILHFSKQSKNEFELDEKQHGETISKNLITSGESISKNLITYGEYKKNVSYNDFKLDEKHHDKNKNYNLINKHYFTNIPSSYKEYIYNMNKRNKIIDDDYDHYIDFK